MTSPERAATNGPVVIVGATSGIGRALARACASEGRGVVVAGRDAASLERIAADCRVRFSVPARVEPLDVLALDEHAAFAARAATGFGAGVDGFILCHGEMPPEDESRRDARVLRRMIDVNYTATVSLLERAADVLAPRGRGFLCAITSVAGDRGRPRNYAYGSSKAAVSAYLSGLRARLARAGLAVVNVEPGVVDTAMTFGLPPGPPRAATVRVARDTLRGIARGRAVVYTPPVWRFVMAIVRCLPDRIFRRLDF